MLNLLIINKVLILLTCCDHTKYFTHVYIGNVDSISILVFSVIYKNILIIQWNFQIIHI